MKEKKEQGIVSIVLLGVIILAVVLAGGYMYWHNSSTTSNPTATPNPTPVYAKEEAKVNITKDGFTPQTITIKRGAEVTWTNKDSKDHQVMSDPHPTHSLFGLVTDERLKTNETVTYTFEKSGTYTYHDELNPLKLKGTVIVQ